MEAHFCDNINGFSTNVQEIIEHFNYKAVIGQLVKNNRLSPIINQYKALELGPAQLSNLEMGYILPDQLFYNTGIFTYIWLLRNEKPASHRNRVMLIDARKQYEKEPKSFGNKRNRIADHHRDWIETRYREGWVAGFADEDVKLFRISDFAYHKVNVVFWQTDENDQPAIVTEPYTKVFLPANMAKEQAFYASDLVFNVRCHMCRMMNISPLAKILPSFWKGKSPSPSSAGKTARNWGMKSCPTNISTATKRQHRPMCYLSSFGRWSRRRRKCWRA